MINLNKNSWEPAADFDRRFSRLVKAMRVLSGFSQKALALRAGLDPEQYSAFENQNCALNESQLKTVCDKIGVNPTLLYRVIEIEDEQNDRAISKTICKIAETISRKLDAASPGKITPTALEDYLRAHARLN
jgi:transcriptional regulator with XRE-family HTH domain